MRRSNTAILEVVSQSMVVRALLALMDHHQPKTARPSRNNSWDGQHEYAFAIYLCFSCGIIIFSPVHGSVFPQAAPILDFAWYPGAMDSDPSTLCFLASVRECPVKLLDAQTGRVCF